MKTLKRLAASEHADLLFGLVFAIVIVSAIYGSLNYRERRLRNQAISRAKQMDGRIYTIDNVAWNWIGDTKLILKNEHGKDAGWIMIYHANPLDSKINPLTLSFTDPYGRVPVPMKIRARYRETPWASKYDGKTKDNFTGSFLEFEVL